MFPTFNGLLMFYFIDKIACAYQENLFVYNQYNEYSFMLIYMRKLRIFYNYQMGCTQILHLEVKLTPKRIDF